MEEYGKEHFAMEVLEHYKLKDKKDLLARLDEREIALIDLFDSYYNGLNGTKGGRDGVEHSMRAVCRYDLDGSFVAEYESVESLKKEFDSVRTIYDCCLHNHTKYAYGSVWRYKDDNTPLPILSDAEKLEATNRYRMLLPIDEYDYKGNLLKVYDNANVLLKQNPDIKRSSLIACCTGKMVYINTKIYRFHGDDFNTYKTYRDKPKLVEQYDTDGNFIRLFESAREAARTLGLKGTIISSVCRGKRKTAGGYFWKYVENKSNFKDIYHNGHCIEVYQYSSKTFELVKIFKSIKDAAKENGL